MVASSKGDSKYQEVDGFLPLPSRKGRQEEQAYRSITVEENPNSDSESSKSGADDDDRSSEDDSDTMPLDSRQETVRSLEEQLTAEPSSISAWLSLLDHSLASLPVTSKNASEARSEIATSILSRALTASPGNRHSVYLRLKYLKSGEEIWHESKTRAEWEDALKVSGEADVWIEWLNWRIRTGAGGVSGVLDDAIRALDNIANGLSAEDADIARLRVLWRVAVLFKETGLCSSFVWCLVENDDVCQVSWNVALRYSKLKPNC